MKRLLWILSFVLLASSAAGQSTNISTTTCPGSGCVDFNVAQQGSIGIQVTGTWSGTLTFQASVSGGIGDSPTLFTSVLVLPAGSTTAVSTTTSNGVWSTPVAGYTTVRVVFTSYSSGTATVSYRTVLSARKNLSGSGSGAPDSATYITQTTNASLSAEQALGNLSSGIARVAATTGIVTSLTTSAGIATNISDETGTGVLTFATAPTFTTSIDIGTAGVKLSDDGDGALTLLGLGNGSDEDLTLNFDDTANTVSVSSSTGVTVLSAPTMQASVLSILLAPTLFAALGTPTNGTLIYCSDCTIASPCAGSGTGALAKRLNGTWVCN